MFPQLAVTLMGHV